MPKRAPSTELHCEPDEHAHRADEIPSPVSTVSSSSDDSCSSFKRIYTPLHPRILIFDPFAKPTIDTVSQPQDKESLPNPKATQTKRSESPSPPVSTHADLNMTVPNTTDALITLLQTLNLRNPKAHTLNEVHRLTYTLHWPQRATHPLCQDDDGKQISLHVIDVFEPSLWCMDSVDIRRCLRCSCSGRETLGKAGEQFCDLDLTKPHVVIPIGYLGVDTWVTSWIVVLMDGCIWALFEPPVPREQKWAALSWFDWEDHDEYSDKHEDNVGYVRPVAPVIRFDGTPKVICICRVAELRERTFNDHVVGLAGANVEWKVVDWENLSDAL